MTTRLEFTEFKHVNLLYTPLNRGSIAVHTCDIAFDNTEVVTLLTEFIILYSISKRLVPEDKSEVKIKIPEGTYTSYQFNMIMKNALKEKGDQWVAPEIKDYKLIIPENFTLIALKPFYNVLGITPKHKIALFKGEYQTKLKPFPKKIALYCEELASLHNQVDGQPSTRLFSLDANYTLHYEPLKLIYLPLSSPPIHSLHLTLLDENH